METLLSIILGIVIIAVVIVGSTLLALFIAQKITDKKMKNNKFLDKKDKKQLEYFIEQDYLEQISELKDEYDIDYEEYWYLEETLEDIYGFCRNLLEGQKKIYTTKDQVLDEEFKKFINLLNIEEINAIFNELENMKIIIFKYYDNDGILKEIE